MYETFLFRRAILTHVSFLHQSCEKPNDRFTLKLPHVQECLILHGWVWYRYKVTIDISYALSVTVGVVERREQIRGFDNSPHLLVHCQVKQTAPLRWCDCVAEFRSNLECFQIMFPRFP